MCFVQLSYNEPLVTGTMYLWVLPKASKFLQDLRRAGQQVVKSWGCFVTRGHKCISKGVWLEANWMWVLTPDRRGKLTSLWGNLVVKTVRKLRRTTLVKMKNPLDNVNAAMLAQIDESCTLLHSLTGWHSVLSPLPDSSTLQLLHRSSSFTTKCLP